MEKLNSIVDGLRFHMNADSAPETDWRGLIDAIRTHSEIIERELSAPQIDRDRLQSIINVIPVAFFVKDAKSRFVLMNRACEDQWGLSFARIRDTDASQFFPLSK